MNILIVGAGIGGLTAALCLLRSGHQVQIFEQSAKFEEVGAGIQCGANALKVLFSLGLKSKLQGVALQPQAAEFRDYATAELKYQMQFGARYEQKYGAPYWHIHRADLQKVLVEAVNQLSPDAIYLNAAVEIFSESDKQVSIQLTNGQIHTGDCLIGADGLRSKVRQQLFPSSQPIFSGYHAWRALIPEADLPLAEFNGRVQNFVGSKGHIVLYPVSSGKQLNVVAVTQSDFDTNESWSNLGQWSDIKTAFTGWNFQVQSVINRLESYECYRWPLYDLKPLKHWSSSRITLLGDAAHACLPYMASGAAMAIEDARILQRSLDSVNQVEAALSQYKRTRLRRTKTVQQRSRTAGQIYHLNSPILSKLVFQGLKSMSSITESFLPEYNANKAPLL